MSGWIKCADRMPENSDLVVVWRKWPEQDEFGPDFDSWENVDACSGECDWIISEDQCQGVEIIADGPGVVERPITSHWKPIGAPDTE